MTKSADDLNQLAPLNAATREGESTQKPSQTATLFVSALAVSFTAAVLFFFALSAVGALPVQDMAQYWAAGHLLTANPYSQESVTAFERSLGLSTDRLPIVIRNPPPVLLFVLPFRFMSYKTAFAFWDVFSVLVLAACARTSYSLARGRPSIAPAVLCLIFGPTIVLLMLGQFAILVLLGITLFLALVERRSDWLAGASLFLLGVKPHLALLFLLAIVLWSVRNKRWGVLMSLGLATLMASAIIAAINPHLFSEYLVFAREFSAETTPYPNLGGMLYLVSGKRLLAFLPQVLGFGWLIYYWRRHRDHWDWREHGMMTLLVSLVSSYYSFPFDQIMILPALMIALARGNRRVFFYAFWAANLGFASYLFGIAGRFGFGYMFLWWTATAWLLTYLGAMRWSPDRKALSRPSEPLVQT